MDIINIDRTNSKKPVKIFVIDSGIDINKSDLRKYVKNSTGFGINNDGYIAEEKTRGVTNDHGTAVSLIIRDIFSKVEFTSVNILSEQLTTDARILIYTLCCCIENKPDIIHLSLGTRTYFYSFALRKVVKEALKNQIIIVAALDNNLGKCYPAYLKGVFGVKGDKRAKKKDYYFDGRFWIAPFGTDGILGIDQLDFNPKYIVGNSMSAAYITGHIAKLIYNKGIKDFDQLSGLLKNSQCNNIL